MKHFNLNSDGDACFVYQYILYIINTAYIHDKKAHYFSVLLHCKYSLINQSTNSIAEKSPAWLLASTQTRLSNILPSWVFDWACLQDQINEVSAYVPGKINESKKDNWRLFK